MPLRHQSIRWDLKPWFRLHMTLTVGGSLNKKQQLTVDLDPLTWSTCAVYVQLQAFPSEDGWGASSLSFFVCRQCWPRSGPTDPNCLKLWRYFWYFFHIHFLETKAPIRPAVRRLVWAFVVPMYQRRIFRDKVHHRLSSKPEIAYHWIESREKRHGGRWVFTFIWALLFAPEQPLTSTLIAKGLISMLCIFIVFCVST